MKYRLINLVGAILLCLSLASCVHEFPVIVPEPVPPPAKNLHIRFDINEFVYNTTIEHGGWSEACSKAEVEHDIRYIVRLYPLQDARAKSGSRGAMEIFEGVVTVDDMGHTDIALDAGIEPGDYDIVAWAEYVPTGHEGDFYHDTSDFIELKLNGADSEDYQHSANNHFREGWRGKKRMTIDSAGFLVIDGNETTDITVEMKRPMARFHFITTDMEQFLSRVTGRTDQPQLTPPFGAPPAPSLDDYMVVVRYAGYMPFSYNLLTDKPVDSRTGVWFEGKMGAIDDKNAELAFDHVFVNGSDTSVQVTLELYRRADGKLLSSTGIIDVPLRRGQYTVIKGPLLTTSASASPGINPDYDGEFNIEIF